MLATHQHLHHQRARLPSLARGGTGIGAAALAPMAPSLAAAMRQRRRWRRALARDDDAAPSNNIDDPYSRAALRLEEVLAAARDNNAGLMTLEDDDPPTLPGAPPPIRGLRLLPPDERLAAASQLGTVLGAASLLVSWVCGADPLGGASLSQQSLEALGMGATLGAAPLAALALLGRAPLARRLFPTLAALQSDTQATLRPLVRGLTPQQVLVMTVWLSLPSCLLLCPTARGLVAALRSTLGVCLFPSSSPVALALPAGTTPAEVAVAAVAAVATSGGVGGGGAAAAAVAAGGVAEAAAAELSLWTGAASDALSSLADAGAGLLPALLASYVAASAVAMALSPRSKQLAAVRDAARSADRWFRLERAHRAGAALATVSQEEEDGYGVASSSPSSPPSSSALAAKDDGHAFRSLALAWARERRSVARLAFVLSAIELLYVHELWDATGDVSAAAGAVTAAWAVELLLAAGGDGRPRS
jgi:hypothetical protein